jgi:hypothetical protein
MKNIKGPLLVKVTLVNATKPATTAKYETIAIGGNE